MRLYNANSCTPVVTSIPHSVQRNQWIPPPSAAPKVPWGQDMLKKRTQKRADVHKPRNSEKSHASQPTTALAVSKRSAAAFDPFELGEATIQWPVIEVPSPQSNKGSTRTSSTAATSTDEMTPSGPDEQQPDASGFKENNVMSLESFLQADRDFMAEKCRYSRKVEEKLLLVSPVASLAAPSDDSSLTSVSTFYSSSSYGDDFGNSLDGMLEQLSLGKEAQKAPCTFSAPSSPTLCTVSPTDYQWPPKACTPKEGKDVGVYPLFDINSRSSSCSSLGTQGDKVSSHKSFDEGRNGDSPRQQKSEGVRCQLDGRFAGATHGPSKWQKQAKSAPSFVPPKATAPSEDFLAVRAKLKKVNTNRGGSFRAHPGVSPPPKEEERSATQSRIKPHLKIYPTQESNYAEAAASIEVESVWNRESNYTGPASRELEGGVQESEAAHTGRERVAKNDISAGYEVTWEEHQQVSSVYPRSEQLRESTDNYVSSKPTRPWNETNHEDVQVSKSVVIPSSFDRTGAIKYRSSLPGPSSHKQISNADSRLDKQPEKKQHIQSFTRLGEVASMKERTGRMTADQNPRLLSHFESRTAVAGALESTDQRSDESKSKSKQNSLFKCIDNPDSSSVGRKQEQVTNMVSAPREISNLLQNRQENSVLVRTESENTITSAPTETPRHGGSPFAGGGIAATAAAAASNHSRGKQNAVPAPVGGIAALAAAAARKRGSSDNENATPSAPIFGSGSITVAAAAAVAATAARSLSSKPPVLVKKSPSDGYSSTPAKADSGECRGDNTELQMPEALPFPGGGIAAAAAAAATHRSNRKSRASNAAEPTGVGALAAAAARKRDASKGGDGTLGQSAMGDVAVASPAAARSRTVESDGPALKDDPEYSKYFKMLKMGLPKGAVQNAMQRDEKDPGILDLDPEKSLKSQKGGRETGDDSPALKDDPEYSKYFKMLKLGLPMGAVKNAMQRDGHDPSIMDRDHDAPAPRGNKISLFQDPIPKDTHRRTRLHWRTHGNACAGTLWAMLDRDPDITGLNVDENEFTNLFQMKIESSVKKTQTASSLGGGTAVKIIDQKRAQNGGIVLARIKLSYEEVAKAIDAFDNAALTPEQIKGIIEYLPTIEEKEQLTSYLSGSGTSVEALCECEKFMVAMMNVSHAKLKLDAVLFMQKFSSTIEELRNDAHLVQLACEEITSSVRFRKILGIVLSIGNRLNTAGPSKKAPARAITLDSLPMLVQARAFDRKTTFVHYLARLVRRNCPDLINFKNEMPSIFKAQRIFWDLTLAELVGLENELDDVRRIALVQGGKTPNEDLETLRDEKLHFEEEMRRLRSSAVGLFTLDACAQKAFLVDAVESSKQKHMQLLRYFGEDQEDLKPHEVFQIIATFCKTFDDAIEEVIADEKVKIRQSGPGSNSLVKAIQKGSGSESGEYQSPRKKLRSNMSALMSEMRKKKIRLGKKRRY